MSDLFDSGHEPITPAAPGRVVKELAALGVDPREALTWSAKRAYATLSELRAKPVKPLPLPPPPAQRCEPLPRDPEPVLCESWECVVCDREVTAELIPLLAGPHYCANGDGSVTKVVRDADGITRVPVPQCPFKNRS